MTDKSVTYLFKSVLMIHKLIWKTCSNQPEGFVHE